MSYFCILMWFQLLFCKREQFFSFHIQLYFWVISYKTFSYNLLCDKKYVCCLKVRLFVCLFIHIKYLQGICSPIFFGWRIFWIIFTFIYFCHQRFIFWLNSKILSFSDGFTIPQKSLFLHTFSWNVNLFSVLKEWTQLKQ